MCEIFDKVAAKGRAEGRSEGLIEGRNNGMLETLGKLVSKGLLSLDNDAREANMSPDEFITRTAELGVGK